MFELIVGFFAVFGVFTLIGFTTFVVSEWSWMPWNILQKIEWQNSRITFLENNVRYKKG